MKYKGFMLIFTTSDRGGIGLVPDVIWHAGCHSCVHN